MPGSLVDVLDAQRTPDDLAADAGTIGYEILTSLGARYQRRYVGGGA
jgi:alanine racemase